jgi:phage RecT family recombinase
MEENTGMAISKPQAMIQTDDFQASVAKALPKGFKSESFLARASLAMISNPRLEKCTEVSLAKCILDSAMLGVELDNVHCYMIPYGTTATLILGYKGLRRIAMRSGLYDDIGTVVVKSGDEFEEGLNNQVIKHTVNRRVDRGDSFAYYAFAKLKDGSFKYEIMSIEDVKSVRAGSNGAKNAVWDKNFDEMSRKTVLRRFMKSLEMGEGDVDMEIKLAELDSIEFDNALKKSSSSSSIEEGKVRDQIDAIFRQKGLRIADLNSAMLAAFPNATPINTLAGLEGLFLGRALSWATNAQ